MSNIIPDSFISLILSKVDLVDLISSRISLKKKGKNYLACCPFHEEKTPSFSVDPIKQFYHCFGCGVSGDAITFLREIDRLTFVETVEVLAAQLGLQVPIEKEQQPQKQIDITKEIYAVLLVASKFFQLQLREHGNSKNVIKYLKSRGLNGHIAKDFNIGYAPPGWENLKKYILQNTNFTIEHLEQAGLVIKKSTSSYDRFRNRIMFPIKDSRGRVIGFGARAISDEDQPKYLNSPETIVFSKGKELYGLYEAKQFTDKLSKIIVVEGYMDVLALSKENIKNVVAVLGTALTFENIRLLFRIVPEIIFCFDGDLAGRKAAWKALEVCLPNIKAKTKVQFLFLPKNEDPDSYIKKYGKNQFLEYVKKAVTLTDFFFGYLTNQMDLELAEDRAILIARAKALLQQIQDDVLKHIMFARLANLASVDCSFLENNTKKQVNYSQYNKNIKPKNFTQLPKSIAVVALSLLLKYPELINLIYDDLELYQDINISGGKIFFAVVKILKTNTTASFEEISSLLPVELARKFIPDELSNIALFVPKSGVKQEFLGVINKIKLLYDEQKLEILLSKAKREGLSAAEKVQLQQLLLKKEDKSVAE